MKGSKADNKVNSKADNKVNSKGNNGVNPVLQNLWSKLLEKINAYEKAVNEGEKDESVIDTRKKSVNSALEAYNTELGHQKYAEKASSAEINVVEWAIRERFVPGAKKIKWSKGEDGLVTHSFVDADIKISLPDLMGVVGAGRFANAKWFDGCRTLAKYYGNKKGRRLNHDGFEYKIEDMTEDFPFVVPEGVKLYSNKYFLCCIQQLFDAILPMQDEHGNKIDLLIETDDNDVPYAPAWDCVTESFTRQGKEIGTVNIGTPYKFTELICDAMHCVLTDKKFRMVQDK